MESEPAKQRRRWILPLAVGALLVGGVAVGGILTYIPPPLAVRRTHDGGVLSLEQVTQGRAHRFRDGSWGQRFLHQVLPEKLKGRVGQVVTPADTDRDALVCWIRRRAEGSIAIPRQIGTVDEHGCEFTHGHRLRAWEYPPSGGGINAVQLGVFPRRQKSFQLRLYDSLPEPPVLLADFAVPNPVAASFPVWTPEALPSRKVDRDLSVTLQELSAGIRAPKRLWTDDTERSEWARIALTLQPKLGPSWGWDTGRVTLWDATGNEWRSGGGSQSQVNQGGGDRREVWIRRGLCPYEPAWKLRVEFVRDSIALSDPEIVKRSAPDAIRRISGLPVPERGQSVPLSRKLFLEGVEVVIDRVTRTEESDPQGDTLTVHLRSQATAQDRQMVIGAAQATDQRGRAADLVSWGGGFSEHTFSLRLAPGARTVDVTVAGSVSRVFEFVVKPHLTEPRRAG